MKKLFSILIAGLFFSGAICNAADSNDVIKQKPLWKTILSYNNWQDMFPVVMKLPDGFLAAGISHHKGGDANYEYKVVLWKIDLQGKELWVKDINLPAWQTGKPFIPERLFSIQEETTLILVNASEIKAWMLKLNNAGEIVFSKEFSPKQVFDIQGVRKINDGLIFYGSAHKGQGNSDARVTKLDPNGNEIWSREYDKGKMEWGTGLAPQKDGGFILSADSGVYNKFGGGPSEAWIIKCDPDGNIMSETTFDGRHPSVIINDNVAAVILNKENFPQQDIAVIGLDENLKVLWRIESLFGKAGGLGMLSAVINKQGNFVLADDRIDKLSVSGLWEINKEGKILSINELEDINPGVLFQSLLQTQNGYILAGHFPNMSKMKLTADGKAAKDAERDSMDILVAEVRGPGN